MSITVASEPSIELAIQATGLEDFSGTSFKNGLEALIHSLNTEVTLGEATASYFNQTIYGTLVNRLQVVHFLKAHPDIEQRAIHHPLIIVGLPRSGTTLLQTLLSLDPAARTLRNYETFPPMCAPAEEQREGADPRIAASHEIFEGMFNMAPNLRGINGLNFMAQGTAECQNLTAFDFAHMGWSAGSSLFSYGDWIADTDLSEPYRWHKKLVQFLSAKQPGDHWVMKAPMHLFGLDHLLTQYPDARVIFTHRNPVQTCVSGISMVCQWTQFSTQQVDAKAVCAWYPKLWAKGLRRALDYKAQLGSNQVLDVFHHQMMKNPLATIELIYNHFEMDLSISTRQEMENWLKQHPRTSFGTHKPTAQQYGLDADEVVHQFDFYMDLFSW